MVGNDIEIFYQHRRVAIHVRSTIDKPTTEQCHRPENHRAYASRSAENYLAWAKTIGPNLLKVVENQLDVRVPALDFPACEAQRKLVTKHGTAEVEEAAKRAVEIQSLTAKTAKVLLSTGRYRRARVEAMDSVIPIEHADIRGGGYYN